MEEVVLNINYQNEQGKSWQWIDVFLALLLFYSSLSSFLFSCFLVLYDVACWMDLYFYSFGIIEKCTMFLEKFSTVMTEGPSTQPLEEDQDMVHGFDTRLKYMKMIVRCWILMTMTITTTTTKAKRRENERVLPCSFFLFLYSCLDCIERNCCW